MLALSWNPSYREECHPDRSRSYKQASLRNCGFTTVTLSAHAIYLQDTIKQASNALDQLA